VDSRTGLAHSAVVTAANVHDKHPLPDLLHGNEQRVYGDSAYASQKESMRSKAPRARDFTNQRVRKDDETREVERSKNRTKSSVRARVEHVFAVGSDCGASARCAIAAWPRRQRVRSSRSGWPTSISRDSA
jgi:transposase, IS5 family